MLNTSILAPVDDNHLSTPELFSGYVPLWYSVDKISFISDHDKRLDRIVRERHSWLVVNWTTYVTTM